MTAKDAHPEHVGEGFQRTRARVGSYRTAFGGQPADAQWLTSTVARGGQVLVAHDRGSGEPAGVGAFIKPLGGVTEVVGVGVRPAFRRRGLAQAMTTSLADAAFAGAAYALVREAWVGIPETFSTRPRDVDRFFAEGQTALVAESARGPVGYLSGAWLGKALAIEEIAVLPGSRRSGIGRSQTSTSSPI